MKRMTLPVREKQIREGEWHLLCPGEGCGARLGKRKGLTVTLETRYTLRADPDYPLGTWWREERGGYNPIPRQRDIRRIAKDDSFRPDPFPEVLASGPQVNVALGRYLSGAEKRRDAYRPELDPGRHIVVCYECGGWATIDNPP
jgi:hypothetical protein